MVKRQRTAAGAEPAGSAGDADEGPSMGSHAAVARQVPNQRARVDNLWGATDAKQAGVDPTSVFIRGLPAGVNDAELRRWIESNAGPTKTCYRIRDDYGLAVFKAESDARRCFEELKDAKLEGSTLRFEAAKPKRKSTQQPQRSSASTAPAESAGGTDSKLEGSSRQGTEKKAHEDGLDLRDVLLKGLPAGLKKEALRAWVEEKLPGGCGIEDVHVFGGEKGDAAAAGAGTRFVVRFRREANARRAVEALQDAEMQGRKVAASFRALEMSRQSAKGGRLIVRNLAFGATAKHVRKEFGKLGELAEVHLPLKSGASATDANPMHRGFAFVQYVDSSIAEKAVAEINGAKICGRGVAVDWAVQKDVYGSLVREEERPKKEKKDDIQKVVEKDDEEEDDEDEEDDDEEESDDDDDSGEDEDEESEEEDDEDKEARDEVARMRKMLGGSEEDKEKKKAKKEAKEENDKKEKVHRDSGYDVGEGRTLFVRNCPFDATEKELRDIFGRFGKIHSVKMVADKSGQNEHSGSVFIKYREADGLEKALAVEADADRKLKELSSVIKRSDQRDFAAVEGFGVSLKGRRLVLRKALAPGEIDQAALDRKGDKGKASEEKSSWMHLLHVGEITETSEGWKNLSKTEKQQRAASMKERKFRVGNSNFAIHPLRLSMRNLPRQVDVTKIREILTRHLAQKDFLKDAGEKKERRRQAQGLVQKIQLMRDSERRAAKEFGSERRSRGFGFITFADHRSAMAGLEILNDNPDNFGGGKRPIVEFAIEDKRKLRMQEELYQRHAHKLLPGVSSSVLLGSKDQKGKAKGKGKGEDAEKGKGKGKGEDAEKGKGKGKGKEGRDKSQGEGKDALQKKKFKHKKKEGMSRGRRQREKKRERRALAETKEGNKQVFEAKMGKVRENKREEARDKTALARKRSTRNEPDAGPSAKKGRPQRAGQMSDDFELRAMERFRSGMR